MPAHLVALTEGPSIPLDKPILLVGRHHECDVQIESRKVSRRHCCIAQVNNHLMVRDLGSTNGIRLNGTRITEARLAERDILTIGTLRYRVTWDEAVAASGPQYEKRAADDDSILENAEDPVALSEPGRPVSSRPASTDEEMEGSIIIPEQLELAPESFRGKPRPPG